MCENCIRESERESGEGAGGTWGGVLDPDAGLTLSEGERELRKKTWVEVSLTTV